MENQEIYENEEIMEGELLTDEETQKGKNPALLVGIGTLIGVGLCGLHKYVVKPIIKKVKAKKESSQELPIPTYDDFEYNDNSNIEE